MKHMLFILLMLPFGFVNAKDKEVKVATKIDEVLVFRQGAQVSRTGKINLSAGTQILVFTGLSNALDPNQIRFNGKGNFTVLSTYHYYKTDTLSGWEYADTRRQLELERSELQNEINRENGWLSIYDREETMLQQNQLFGKKDEGIEIQKLIEAAEFTRQRYMDIRAKRLEIHDRVAELQKQINEINEELGKLQGITTETTFFFAARVNAKTATTGTVTLSYQVGGAGWTPGYDARVMSVNEPLSLTQNAFVFQNSGEEWDNVKLTISTGSPQRTRTKPNLTPWYVGQVVPTPYYAPSPIRDVGQMNSALRRQSFNPNVRNVNGRLLDANGEPLIGATVMIPGYNVGAVTDVYGNYSLTVPQGATSIQYSYIGHSTEAFNISGNTMNVYLGSNEAVLDAVTITAEESVRSRPRRDRMDDLEEVEMDMEFAAVAIDYTPTQTEFKVDARYDIPSDGTKYAVQVQQLEMEANFIYQCTPKLDPLAYLTARITDWEDYNLFDGPMNIYFEDSYVGKANLGLQYVEDTLSLSLGPDQRIEVRRKRVKADQKKQVLSGTRKDIREWNYIVKNNKRESIRIQIDDQVPVTTSEEIEIEMEALNGGDLNEATGIITWDLEVGSGKQKDFRMKYNIRYPKDMRLSYR